MENESNVLLISPFSSEQRDGQNGRADCGDSATAKSHHCDDWSEQIELSPEPDKTN